MVFHWTEISISSGLQPGTSALTTTASSLSAIFMTGQQARSVVAKPQSSKNLPNRSFISSCNLANEVPALLRIGTKSITITSTYF